MTVGLGVPQIGINTVENTAEFVTAMLQQTLHAATECRAGDFSGISRTNCIYSIGVSEASF